MPTFYFVAVWIISFYNLQLAVLFFQTQKAASILTLFFFQHRVFLLALFMRPSSLSCIPLGFYMLLQK